MWVCCACSLFRSCIHAALVSTHVMDYWTWEAGYKGRQVLRDVANGIPIGYCGGVVRRQ